MATRTLRTGRPRNSHVWDYYIYDAELDKSECQVLTGDKVCGVKINGKFPSNLRSHIKNYHAEVFKILDGKDKEKAKNVRKKEMTPKSSSQYQLAQVILGSMKSRMYDTGRSQES